ncbi:MAG: DUF2723 domain-containing protein [Desulfuromonadaceae bacterium]|nr:DUF2723 domain-containing protein [Desulfuromonadaceae bacterium]MDD5106410.1 DUF2723 domain-containing protein [Desulfuromonadaceae bacterium]
MKNIFKIDVCLVLSFLIPFGLYLVTLAPSVTFFDSGEFLTAAASLGSAHSPGYPLFLMYAKPFSWLPVGNIAFRINVATAVSSSLACLMVYILATTLLEKETVHEDDNFNLKAVKFAGLSAALTFSVTPRLWLQSNHDKPYPLLAFMTTVIFYLLLRWRAAYIQGNDRPSYIYVGTFLAGLAMAVHQTIVLLLPAWFLMILLVDWRIVTTRVKELLLAILFGLLGFMVHLYLPLRALSNPLLNWGDAKTVDQFLWHFLRKGYPTEPPVRSISLVWAQLCAFNVPREFTWLGAMLTIIGLAYLWKKNRTLLYGYLVSVIVFLFVIAGYLNTPFETIFLTEEFFTPLYLLTAVLIGIGLHSLLGYTVRSGRLPDHIGAPVYGFVIVLFFSLPSALCAVNYYENDQHNNYIAFDYASNSLRSLPQNAIMFTWGDSGAFPLWYLQGIERMREDVDLPHTPHLVFSWYLDSMPRVFKNSNLRKFDITSSGPEAALHIAVAENLGRRPVYVDFSTRYSVEFAEYLPFQRGIVYRMRKANEPSGVPDNSLWDNYASRGIFQKQSFLDLDTGKAILIYANSYLEAGEFLAGINRQQEAAPMLKKAEQISPEIRASVEQVRMRHGMER